jgi:hypothetical protein
MQAIVVTLTHSTNDSVLAALGAANGIPDAGTNR